MIKIEHVETAGWAAAFRGMRNPMNSWAKGDSGPDGTCCGQCPDSFEIGPNDKDLAMRLRNAGVEHRKYMRMLIIWCDVTAPLKWWKQYATYKQGTVENSCSTMHKIHAKEFTRDDFSCENLLPRSLKKLDNTIEELNFWRDIYINGGSSEGVYYEPKNDRVWLQLTDLLPDTYIQKRTCMLSYETATKQYKERRHHKLQEWHDWCDFLETLPASELITGEE